MERSRRAAVIALCSVVGLMAGLAGPAMAHTNSTNIQEGYPNEDNGDGQFGFAGAHGPDTAPQSSEGEIVSDVLDTGANFSAVTDTVATAYGWIGCGPTGDPTTSTPGGACDVFGVDTSGKAGMMPIGSPQAHYWRLQTKIPVDYEGGPFDLYGISCASDGNPATQPTDTNHCTVQTVPNAETCVVGATGTCIESIHFDHTAVTTDHGATTGGRIESVGAGNTTCNSIEAHGCALPNLAALKVTAVSGPAPNSADSLGFCLESIGTAPFAKDFGAPASDAAPPTAATCEVFALDGSPAAGPGGTDLWEVTFPAAMLLSNNIYWLSITEHQDDSGADAVVESGKGDCQGDNVSNTGDDCQLDAAEIIFNPGGQGGPPAPPAPPPGPPPPPPTPDRDGDRCNRVIGNARDNILVGTKICDVIKGKAGDDLMRGKRARDRLRGGGGFDIAKGGKGNDRCTAERERSC